MKFRDHPKPPSTEHVDEDCEDLRPHDDTEHSDGDSPSERLPPTRVRSAIDVRRNPQPSWCRLRTRTDEQMMEYINRGESLAKESTLEMKEPPKLKDGNFHEWEEAVLANL